MYCKDCKFNLNGSCDNWYITERDYDFDNLPRDEQDKCLVYSYCEYGDFAVGDYFGCVHFQPARTSTPFGLVD